MSEDSRAFDSVLGLCRHQHRRIVLGTLLEEGRPLTLDDLTTVVLTYNHQTPMTEASAELLTEIRRTLYHVHLPKLAAAGLVDYDPEGRVAEPTAQLAQVQSTVSTIIDADSSLDVPMTL